MPHNSPLADVARCPTNQKVGKSIDILTLKALLALPLTQVTYSAYCFCPDPKCPTVYYSANGAQTFEESDLHTKVYQKHLHNEEAVICYCFRHSRKSIRDEMIRTGTSTVVEQITTGIRVGQCACDIRNPQGDCCLGNVRQAVKRIRAELAQHES